MGSVLTAVETGLQNSGSALLGGDIELRLVHRFATAEELAHFETLGTVSTIVEFRGNLETDDGDRAFAQIKAADSRYPLYGDLMLEPSMPIDAALASSPLPGLVAAPELADRLGLRPGDTVWLGSVHYQYRAAILGEPDRSGGGFSFGPRAIVALDTVVESGLLAPGSLYYPHYRLRTNPGLDLEAEQARAESLFPDSGWRWRDRRSGAPGVERFVQRIGAFLSLVALASLALGGVGAGAAVRAYLQRKTATIAILRSLGAGRATVAAVFLLQTIAIATLGVAVGLAIGSGLPLSLGPLLAGALPVPAEFDLYAAPLLRAAAAGYLTALLFALPPIARACGVSAAALFRDEVAPAPANIGWRWKLAIAAAAAALLAIAYGFFGDPLLVTWFVGFFAVTLLALAVAGEGVARLARRLAPVAGFPPLRRALAQIGGAGGDARGIAVSVGTSIAILVAVALTENGLRGAITSVAGRDPPEYFVLDIPDGRLSAFRKTAAEFGRAETAPMLRGFVTGINGVRAVEADIDPEADWVLQGDRGMTYASHPPEGAQLVEGSWWPEDYIGDPLVSFSAEEAAGLGLTVGSTVTVNVLGRPLTATVANLREIEWRGLGMNFLMVFTPASLSAAPHTHIATVYLPDDQSRSFQQSLAACCPEATAVSVREGVETVRATLTQIAAAALWGSGVTLLTGLAVLVGVAAAGQRRQLYESAIFKALGATRREILGIIALKWALLGAAAALIALVLGAGGAWAVLRFVMETEFVFSAQVSIVTVLAGAGASLAAGVIFAGSALRASPATLLRARD